MSKFHDMSDDYLRRTYVPDVYQPSIYKIDYQKLKDAGITFISFDIDDTIAGLTDPNPPKEAKTLFESLKRMGFEVVLLSNTWDARASNFAKKLGLGGAYVARAEKPLTAHFAELQADYGLEKSQMAHVGNSMRDDIAGGNAFGVTTCLVRRVGTVSGLVKLIPGVKTEGQKLRKEMLERGIWCKHHQRVKGDQYYQLGDLPGYLSPEHVAEAAAASLVRQFEADQDTTYTMEELMQKHRKDTEKEAMKTLRTHLGKNIVFTGVWDDGKDGRELQKADLSDGELSGCVYSVGGYTVRSTVCLFRDDDEVDYSEKVPATPDQIAEYEGNSWGLLAMAGMLGSGYREVQVISAKRKDGADWVDICMATSSMRWQESVEFICTLKYGAKVPDGEEMLFVFKQYVGDSFGVGDWYRMSPGGTVTEFQEHPYDSDSFQTSWKDD